MAKEGKFDKFSDDFLSLVGGKDNVKLLTHCVSRLRIEPVDKDKVDVKAIESYDCVVGTVWAGNMLHIIIGNSVPDCYNLIKQKTGLGNGEVSVDGQAKGKTDWSIKGIFNIITDAISGAYVPCIPIIIACGFFKIIVLVGESAGFLTAGIGTDLVLSWVGDAGFYFLPVYVGYTSAAKFGANPFLGMFLGAILMHPNFTNAVSAGTTITLFGITVPSISYASSFIPTLMSVAVMAPIQKFIGKHSPEAIRSVTEPFLTMLIIVPLSLWFIAPIATYIGNGIAAVVLWIYSKAGFIAAGLMGALFQFFVLTGTGAGLMPYLISQFASGQGESLMWPAGIIASACQGVCCLAIALKTKDKKTKGVGISCGATALASSVYEPALFALTFRYRIPLYCSMIGATVGATVAALGGATAFAMTGTTNLFAVAVFTPYMQGFWFEIIGIIIGCIVTFALTYITWKDELLDKYI